MVIVLAPAEEMKSDSPTETNGNITRLMMGFILRRLDYASFTAIIIVQTFGRFRVEFPRNLIT